MIRFLNSIIAHLMQENPELMARRVGGEGRGRTRYIPGGLEVSWRVIDRQVNGDLQRASGVTIVAFQTADQVREILLQDLKRIFNPLPGANVVYQVDVRPMVA